MYNIKNIYDIESKLYYVLRLNNIDNYSSRLLGVPSEGDDRSSNQKGTIEESHENHHFSAEDPVVYLGNDDCQDKSNKQGSKQHEGEDVFFANFASESVEVNGELTLSTLEK